METNKTFITATYRIIQNLSIGNIFRKFIKFMTFTNYKIKIIKIKPRNVPLNNSKCIATEH